MTDTEQGRVLRHAERFLPDGTNIAVGTTVPGLLPLAEMDMIHTPRAERDLRHQESVRYHLLGVVVLDRRLRARADMKKHARVLIAHPFAGSHLVPEMFAIAEIIAVARLPLLGVIGLNPLSQTLGGVDRPPQLGQHTLQMMLRVGARLQHHVAHRHHRCILVGPLSWLTIALRL
jgi:hypothetical protein